MEDVVEPVLRCAHYTLLLGLFGWSAFWLLGLRSVDWLRVGRALGFAVLAALVAPVVSAALMLMSIAAMMGVPVVDLDRPMVEAMIFGTDIGFAFIVRTGLLVAGLVAILALGRCRAARIFAAGFYGSALVTLGWSGHAAVTEGGLGLLHRLNNGIHLISAGLWLGAIGWFLVLTSRCYKGPDETKAHAVLKAMHAFAPMGISLVALVAVTGTVNSHLIFGLPNVAATLSTPYGILLAIKLALVAAMVAVGAHHARVSRGAATAERHGNAYPAQALGALLRTLLAEFLLGLLVIGLVAVFGSMSPTMM
ncbi:CopD family protein [Sphingomonas sp. CJ99]